MYIIKHKTRRKTGRAHDNNAAHYYVVAGHITFGELEQAAEEMQEGYKDLLKLAPQAPTLADVYPVLSLVANK